MTRCSLWWCPAGFLCPVGRQWTSLGVDGGAHFQSANMGTIVQYYLFFITSEMKNILHAACNWEFQDTALKRVETVNRIECKVNWCH